MSSKKVRVGVNGYGVIGKRIADVVATQEDVELVGLTDVVSDWRFRMAVQKDYSVNALTPDAAMSLIRGEFV